MDDNSDEGMGWPTQRFLREEDANSQLQEGKCPFIPVSAQVSVSSVPGVYRGKGRSLEEEVQANAGSLAHESPRALRENGDISRLTLISPLLVNKGDGIEGLNSSTHPLSWEVKEQGKFCPVMGSLPTSEFPSGAHYDGG